ncbi:MAG: hypothetical protein Q9170_005091 [Blastenia crenularia]
MLSALMQDEGDIQLNEVKSIQTRTSNYVSSTPPDQPPERYAQRVVQYSKFDTPDAYLSGTHYSRLSKFLISPYQFYGDEWVLEIPEHGFNFVTLCDLTKKREDTCRTKHFCRPDDFIKFLDSLDLNVKKEFAVEDSDGAAEGGNYDGNGIPMQRAQDSRSRSGHSGIMVFLRGFPSPQWLNHLGAALDIDPELYSRHLDVSAGSIPDASRQECSYSTPFPNTQDLMELRVCNTGSWDTTGSTLDLNVLRERCEASMSSHLDDFLHWRNIAVGDSVVRRIILHDMREFAIEQRITIEVIYHTRTWSSRQAYTFVVCMDSGKDLSHCKSGPWLKRDSVTGMTSLHPVYQHRGRMAMSSKSSKTESVKIGEKSTGTQLPQTIEHLHKNYGRYLKTEIMAHDAFYALNELFEFSAASIDQLLEVFEGKLRTRSQFSDARLMAELLIAKNLIDDYRHYVKDILDVVSARGGARWPRVTGCKQREKADRAADRLEARYKRLLRRCDRLLDHCANSITILVTVMNQKQTEKAITQADRLSKLSVLAYIFIPLTFASGFYGMNFKELGNELSIWTYFALAAPLLVVALSAWFINVRSARALCWNFIQKTPFSARKPSS